MDLKEMKTFEPEKWGDHLEMILNKCEKALKEVEWSGYVDNSCPDCSLHRSDGHNPECFIKESLDLIKEIEWLKN